jgi:pyruvate formate lyase activating enzyme
MHKRNNPSTTEASLKKLFGIASEKLDYVYIGNYHSGTGQNTSCPSCGNEVTIRSDYNIRILNLDKEGKCIRCGNLIYKHFIFP